MTRGWANAFATSERRLGAVGDGTSVLGQRVRRRLASQQRDRGRLHQQRQGGGERERRGGAERTQGYGQREAEQREGGEPADHPPQQPQQLVGAALGVGEGGEHGGDDREGREQPAQLRPQPAGD